MKLNQYETTIDKYECILRFFETIFDVVKITSMKNELASADDTESLFIYLLIKASP